MILFTKKYFFYTLFFIGYLNLISQDYFPLNVGDKWYFENKPYSIDSTKQIGDFLYYKVPLDYGYQYYRKDTLGNVYGYFNETDTLIYKFDAEVGDTWLIPGEYQINYEVKMLSKNDTLTISGDTLKNCIKLYLRATNAFDADSYYWFAENIGLIKKENLLWGGPHELSKGVFGGIRFPKDKEFLKVTSTFPLNSQINISLDTSVTINFNYWIKPRYVSNDYVKLRYDNGEVIKGNTSYGWLQNNLVFTPLHSFKNDSTIVVTISSSISDYIDDSLSSDYQFKFSTGEDITAINLNKVENLFSLSQNYPNPFNPTTNIKFTIPQDVKRETSNTKLIVYDILGREINTLLNKPMQPGNYEVEFNGSNLPSGVYFYRLTSGQFIQTKKMLLLK